MGIRDKVSYIIYRYAAKGLEVFVLDDAIDPQSRMRLPKGELLDINFQSSDTLHPMIELDAPSSDMAGSPKVFALEADWHELPSVREALGEDMAYVKAKVKELSSDFEKGTYIGIKEAFKKVMPHEYALLKELKDILMDKNTIENI